MPFHCWNFRYKEIASLNGEEEECAIYLDQLPQVEFWVRNIERRESHSFWLQTSTDKFYPDFVCKLKDGRFLVVEYKSETSWSNEDSREKRVLGELWEKRSNGACLFMMPKGNADFSEIIWLTIEKFIVNFTVFCVFLALEFFLCQGVNKVIIETRP